MEQMSKEELYEQHRLRMNYLNREYRRLFYIYLIFAGVLFFTTLYASVIVGNDRSIVGTDKFYVSFATGLIQILLAAGVLITGFFVSMKSAAALVIQIAGLVALLTISLLGIGALAKANCVFALIGLGFSGYALKLYREYAFLKEQPGFPLFSLRAETPAKYVPPLNVQMNQSGREMDEIQTDLPQQGAGSREDTPLFAEQPLGTALSESMLSDMRSENMTGIAEEHHHVTLNPGLSEEQRSGLSVFSEPSLRTADTAMETLPQLSPAAVLADMDSGVPHKAVHGALPDPEEVKVRLRRMKEEKDAAEKGIMISDI